MTINEFNKFFENKKSYDTFEEAFEVEMGREDCQMTDWNDKFYVLTFDEFDYLFPSDKEKAVAEEDAKESVPDIKFTCNIRHQNCEWIDGKFNVAFTGKMEDEQAIRDYILGKFEALDTMQLITLLRGESYTAVIGADVEAA